MKTIIYILPVVLLLLFGCGQDTTTNLESGEGSRSNDDYGKPYKVHVESVPDDENILRSGFLPTRIVTLRMQAGFPSRTTIIAIQTKYCTIAIRNSVSGSMRQTPTVWVSFTWEILLTPTTHRI